MTKEIITQPEKYLLEQAKSLKDRLKQIELPKGTEEQLASDRTRKIIRDRVLGMFKLGELISEFLNWNDTVNRDIDQAKKDLLIANYLERTDQNGEAIARLERLITSGHGNALFNKILRILEDSPPDVELIGHLSSALAHIADSDFAAMFDQHKYALAQIEQLSPQALTIMADHRRWPIFTLGSFTSMGTQITSDWLPNFAETYAQAKAISDTALIARLQHSLNELFSRRMIAAHTQGRSVVVCGFTAIGRELLPYIDK